MARTDSELRSICAHLLDGRRDPRSIAMTLDEFKRLYGHMNRMSKKPPKLSLVKLLEGEVVAQFSNIAPQRFVITHSEPLTPETFSFDVEMSWHGSETESETFVVFLRKEFRRNWIWLSLVFLASAVLLFLADSINLYELTTTLLIQSGTVFLSIYLIFTVSQSQRLAQDQQLFEMGVTHQYFSDDKNVTTLAIFTIALTFVNSMVISILNSNPFAVDIRVVTFDSRILQAMTTAVVIMLLFNSFLTVAGYYLGRTLDVMERSVMDDILHKEYEEHYRYAKSNGRTDQ